MYGSPTWQDEWESDRWVAFRSEVAFRVGNCAVLHELLTGLLEGPRQLARPKFYFPTYQHLFCEGMDRDFLCIYSALLSMF